MRIIWFDERKGVMRLRVECVDDLWVIKNVIQEGDVVIARTLRDIKIDGEGKRRKPMILAVRVKNVYFQPFASRLRIHGVIVDAPEGYGLKGSHHTLNIDVGTEFEIVKERWLKSQVRRLEKASSRWVKALLVAADFDEVSAAVMYRQGIKYLIDSSLPGISESDPKSIDRIAGKVAEIIKPLISREGVEAVIIGSPAVLRERIAEELRGLKELRSIKLYTDSVSHGGRAGIEELIRRDSVKKLLAKAAAVDAEETINEFMRLLATKPGMVSAGLKEVEMAVKSNAVSKMLVLEDLLTGEEGEVVEELIDEAERRGAKVRIVSSTTTAAPKLKAFGGIIAIHRFRIDYLLLNRSGDGGGN